ncbi:Hypothetical protein CINCED_3A023564 [Cinara cedri]|uniref:Uncharacterized protein n=1 Tax=Cinara cedri TaxID=506608 RepID=A0A5E4MCB3_9HEMI|nr:Hypothetical protein CINCED_3A023564 [Cinara cedri]
MAKFLRVLKFRTTSNKCVSAIAINHGIKETFSTGSQNQNPPHPSSRYAHQLPRLIPKVSNDQDISTQGLTILAQAPPSIPVINPAIESEKATLKPRYPRYNIGG